MGKTDVETRLDLDKIRAWIIKEAEDSGEYENFLYAIDDILEDLIYDIEYEDDYEDYDEEEDDYDEWDEDL